MKSSEFLSLYGDENAELEVFLAHHGVKGMHWGVRRQRTAEDVRKDLARIERKRNTSISRKVLPASSVIAGAGARAGTAKKVLKLKAVKNPDGSIRLVPTKKTPEITPENRSHYNKKIDRRTYAKYAATGAVVVASLLASAYLGKTRISDPNLSKLAVKGSLFLAGAQTLQTTSIVSGVHRNIKDDKIREQRQALKKELKSLS